MQGARALPRVDIGHGPFSTGSVQPWPHHRLETGQKPFNTGSCYEPVLKVHKEPV
jgi:hypothetical protein